jgi:glycosyltransferase involved in cell wall biosynthesis
MFFYVNGRFLTKPVAGVVRYALELFRQVDALLETEAYSGLQVICLVPPEQLTDPGWKNIEIRKVGINRQNLWEQVDLPMVTMEDLLFSPGNSGPILKSRQVLTIHDASVFAFPRAYSFLFRLKFKIVLGSLVKRASLVLTNSRFSRRELAKYFQADPDRFDVIYYGADHMSRLVSDVRILERNHLENKGYMLTVATNSPHKNLACVISAAEKIRRQDMQFIAVGGTFQRVFQSSGLGDLPQNVRLLGNADSSELKALYENAAGLIFPSLYEGFGFPVVEAMGLGCPVLCSSAASLPEVAGEAALFFDPQNPADLVDKLDQFLSDPSLQETLRLRGYEQAAKFRWETTARQTLDKIIPLLS